MRPLDFCNLLLILKLIGLYPLVLLQMVISLSLSLLVLFASNFIE